MTEHEAERIIRDRRERMQEAYGKLEFQDCLVAYQPRELDARVGDGLEVVISWDPATDSLTLDVADTRTHKAHRRAGIPMKDYHEAFNHPFRFID